MISFKTFTEGKGKDRPPESFEDQYKRRVVKKQVNYFLNTLRPLKKTIVLIVVLIVMAITNHASHHSTTKISLIYP